MGFCLQRYFFFMRIILFTSKKTQYFVNMNSFLFKTDKTNRWCFNAKDICQQVNPKGLWLAPLISSAFPPLCKFCSCHSHLFLCLHIAWLGFFNYRQKHTGSVKTVPICVWWYCLINVGTKLQKKSERKVYFGRKNHQQSEYFGFLVNGGPIRPVWRLHSTRLAAPFDPFGGSIRPVRLRLLTEVPEGWGSAPSRGTGRQKPRARLIKAI